MPKSFPIGFEMPKKSRTNTHTHTDRHFRIYISRDDVSIELERIHEYDNVSKSVAFRIGYIMRM